ncbi:hypothetical protein B0T24DRAFT_698369 [Lasiosphaeria ovina]|uniref:Protein kinase domain-containing protein n=1 Tax=Lasiosphaeria ovina TaxID=92902 RepID=A0AAE0KG25_9PEZI|nr:hypothetical protein B0T24DRAFT_698369 [Lasiosphaeria ovina]
MDVHNIYKVSHNRFVTIHRAVNLHTGALQVVREMRIPTITDEEKGSAEVIFKFETLVLELLRIMPHKTRGNDNLIEPLIYFDTHNAIEGSRVMTTYYGDYDGTVADLHEEKEHICLKPRTRTYPWLDDLLIGIAGGLQFLEQNKMIHHSIKLDNVWWKGVGHLSDGTVMRRFFLGPGDYDLVKTLASRSESGPRLSPKARCRDKAKYQPEPEAEYYLAPEVVLQGETHEKSDMWSVGILFGQLMGYWCANEYGTMEEEVSVKFKCQNFCVKYRQASVRDLGNNTEAASWWDFVESLVESKDTRFSYLTPKHRLMLQSNPDKRLTVANLYSYASSIKRGTEPMPEKDLSTSAKPTAGNQRAAAAAAKEAVPKNNNNNNMAHQNLALRPPQQLRPPSSSAHTPDDDSREVGEKRPRPAATVDPRPTKSRLDTSEKTAR